MVDKMQNITELVLKLTFVNSPEFIKVTRTWWVMDNLQ
jgi:hypothetical protein